MSARRWIGACAVLAVVVSACGGSDSHDAAQSTLRVAWVVAGSGELLTVDLAGGTPRSHRGDWWPDGGPRALSTPAWSPDGERVAYFEWASPRGKVLYVDDLEGERTAVTKLLTGPAAPDLSTAPPQAPLWSPDGRKLAFRRADANVRVVDVTGGASWTVPTRRLATDWYGIGLAWAPEGERLAITIDFGPHEGTWIARKGRLHRFRPQGSIVRDPAWSPDGRWIAYSHEDGRGTDQIYVSDPDAVHTLRVTNDLPREPGAHFSNSAPVWSPDGSAIAFLSNREGRHSTELFVVGADGFGQRRLTRGVAVTALSAFAGGRTPAVRWSPDGRRLAFLGWGWHARPRVGVVDVDVGGVRRLAPAPLDDGHVAGLDLAWLGAPERSSVHTQVPSRAVPERRVTVARDHLPDGPARLGRPRLVLRRSFDDSATYDEHVDVSPDGSTLSFLTRLDDHRFEVGVLDLGDGSRRVLTTGATNGTLERGGRFSPDGRRIVFRRWATLQTVDVATEVVELAAAQAGEGPVSWLADGRVTYLDPAGRLRFSGPGGVTGVRTGEQRAVAVSADGELAVVRGRCKAILVDVRSGRRKPVAWGLVPDPDSWSPDGSLIALHRPEHDECGPRLGTRGGDVVLFDRAGSELGTLLGTREPHATGASLYWTRDSRRLLATVEYSGSRPPPSPLYVFSAADRTVGRAVTDLGAWGNVIGVARDRIVFVRFRSPDEWQFVVARL